MLLSYCFLVCNMIFLQFTFDPDMVVFPTGHTGRLLKSLCFTSMTFLLFHIIYQITVNSLLVRNSINSDFNCESNKFFNVTQNHIGILRRFKERDSFIFEEILIALAMKHLFNKTKQNMG